MVEAPPDGMSPSEQLAAIRRELEPMLDRKNDCWGNDLLPKLRANDICVMRYGELQDKQRHLIRDYFEKEMFPALTPLAFDQGHPFPHISNLSHNLAVVVNDPDTASALPVLRCPAHFERLIRIPNEESAGSLSGLRLGDERATNFVWVEDVVAANLDMLFPGLEIKAAYPFRVTRDADIEIEEDEAADLLDAIETGVGLRYFGKAVRLEVDVAMPDRVATFSSRTWSCSPIRSIRWTGRWVWPIPWN